MTCSRAAAAAEVCATFSDVTVMQAVTEPCTCARKNCLRSFGEDPFDLRPSFHAVKYCRSTVAYMAKSERNSYLVLRMRRCKLHCFESKRQPFFTLKISSILQLGANLLLTEQSRGNGCSTLWATLKLLKSLCVEKHSRLRTISVITLFVSYPPERRVLPFLRMCTPIRHERPRTQLQIYYLRRLWQTHRYRITLLLRRVLLLL